MWSTDSTLALLTDGRTTSAIEGSSNTALCTRCVAR